MRLRERRRLRPVRAGGYLACARLQMTQIAHTGSSPIVQIRWGVCALNEVESPGPRLVLLEADLQAELPGEDKGVFPAGVAHQRDPAGRTRRRPHR